MPFGTVPPLYSVWKSMRARCRNQHAKTWADYGGRGITICDRWDLFKTFVEDMGPRPEGLSLDRIDNDGDYTPENCRWADRRTQQRNQRRAVYVTIEGVRHRLIELAELANRKPDTLAERARRGMTYAEVMSPEKYVSTVGLALGGRASGAVSQARTHCKRGHEFTAANTYITKEGWRNCRKCAAGKVRRRSAAKMQRRHAAALL